jgi:hypothetical protein
MLRFLYSLIALALVLSPLGMSQGMAMAHAPEAAVAEGHCRDSQAPADQGKDSKAMLDCMGICSAIAAGGELPPVRHLSPPAAVVTPSPAALSGLNPESEPPPPRAS